MGRQGWLLDSLKEPVKAVSKLNRESLYRMLSRSGNPSLASLHAVLGAHDLRRAA